MKILDVPRSGSYQAITSSRNRFGQYVRTRAMPIQPRTDAQIFVRALLASLSAAWRALTDLQRAAWVSYANTAARTDSLGQTVFQTGAQSYVGVNLSNNFAGQAVTNIPPAGDPPPPIDAPTFVADLSSGLVLTFAVDPTSTNPYMVSASPPLSPGVTFNGDFRFLQVSPGPLTAHALNITTAYNAKFGVPPLGSKIFVRIVGWQNDQVTIATQVSGIAVA